jgi:transposase
MPAVKARMQRDGRKLDRKAQEAIRRMAVERVREGERPSRVIAGLGMNRTTIHKWLARARGRGAGLRRRKARQSPGRPRSLTPRPERRVFRWVNGNNPMQYGFDSGLGTRHIVREPVREKFGVRLGLASIGARLARLNLTPQKPLARAYQRDPQAIARRKQETYPAIARQAGREKADSYFWDESGFRADAVHGKTWARRGQTPVVQVPGQRQSMRAASAVNAKGAFRCATYKGALSGELFVALLRKPMHRRKRPLHLALDGLPAHKKGVVKDHVASLNGRLQLHFLPGYAPELNPDELVWGHAKRTGTARRPLKAGETLAAKIDSELNAIKRNPASVRSFFEHPSVAYISDY